MIEIKITENESQQRLDRFLRKYLKEYSLGDIYKLFRKNKVRVNKKKVKENYMLSIEDMVQLFIPDSNAVKADNTLEIALSQKPIEIVYEDDNILLVNKPIGLLTHPDKAEDKDTLINRVFGYLFNINKALVQSPTFKPAVCNRLDRNTGGFVIVAKNYTALKQINEMIRNFNINKYYKCIVKGTIKNDGEIKGYLVKNEKDNIVSISSSEVPDSKAVHTIYRVKNSNKDYSLLEIELITGRSHQIRASFSSICHPLIGDTKYGSPTINQFFKDGYKLTHQFLYAYALEFGECSEELKYLEGKKFICPMPEYMQKIEKDLF